MKKLFTLIAAVLFAGSMMADSYTIEFKDNGTSSDGNTSLTSTTVADYIATGAEYVSAIEASGKVYNAQTGYGLKFGNSSNPGAVTLTLATPVQPTSIVMNASPWSATEGAGLLQDSVYETKSTGAKGTFADFTYAYDGNTEVTTIIVGTSSKRGFVKSITVNYGGSVTPPEPTCTLSDFLGNGSGNAAYDNRFKVCLPEGVSVVNIQNSFGTEAGIYLTFPSADFGTISLDAAQYATQGAGMLLYVSAFLSAAETEVTVVCGGVTYAITVLNANPETTPVVLPDPTNCAEAREAALSVSANNELYKDGAVYSITGYVTAIQTAYSSQHNNVSFWMADAADGGNVIQAYRAACATAEDAPVVGDKVTVTGSLTKYGTTPEFAAGCTFVIVEHTTVLPVNLGEKTIAEFLALANTVDTCVITGVVANIKTNADGTYNKYGNFDLVDGEASVYVYGLLTAAGEAQKFQEMGVDENDTLTVKAVYSLYNNAVQAKNAVFVVVKKYVAPALTIPTEAPAAPTQDEANVMAIYCNHYATNNANFGISGWAGAYQTLDLDGTNVGYWTGMTWECIIDPVNTDSAHNFSAYEYVHIDMWAPQAAKIKFVAEAVAGGNYKDGHVVELAQGWNSFDFAIAEWPGNYDFANLKCFVFEGYKTPADESFEGNPFAFANIYFWADAVEDPYHPYEEDSDFEVAFASYTVDASSLAEYGDVYVEAEDEEGNYIILDVTIPEEAEGLVAGVYPVAEIFEYPAQSVASGFYYEGYGIFPSYAATLVEYQGEMYLNEIWYIVSGTITVDEALNITVDALNSLGHTVRATLAAPKDGIENTNVETGAVKFLKNGQLIIEKNNVRYNVIGAVVR